MRILAITIVAILLTSCNDSEKEKELQIREQNIEMKEDSFTTKEQEFQQLLQMRDSLNSLANQKEIESPLPVNLLGKWNGKMVCTESNCADHIIGDQRNDLWEFSGNSLKIINKSGGERTFQGKVTGTEIKFTSPESISNPISIEMIFNISDLQKDRLKGIRNLTGKDDCTAQFSVDLQKIIN